MTPHELGLAIEAYADNARDQFERDAHLAACTIRPHVKRSVSARKLIGARNPGRFTQSPNQVRIDPKDFGSIEEMRAHINRMRDDASEE